MKCKKHIIAYKNQLDSIAYLVVKFELLQLIQKENKNDDCSFKNINCFQWVGVERGTYFILGFCLACGSSFGLESREKPL